MAGFHIKRQIARWQRDGLIDQSTADRLRADVAGSRSRFGLGGILALLGAILLGAAIVTLIAANWDAIPRLARFGIIVSAIWISYVGGAWRGGVGDDISSRALFLVGSLTFGSGIALVSQMYHLSGDAATAALIWVGGTLVAALLLRSPVLVSAAVIISAFYLLSALDQGVSGIPSYVWVMPVLLGLNCLLAWYSKSRLAWHVIALLTVVYIFVTRFDLDDYRILWLAAGLGGTVFLAEALWTSGFERWTRWGDALGAYGFLMLLLALIFVQFDEGSRGVLGQVLISVVVLACAISGLVLSGHRNLMVRWLAYAAFSAEVLYLAFETIGTMIGTAGFFLSAGILVLLLAAFVIRMERRLQTKSAGIEMSSQ